VVVGPEKVQTFAREETVVARNRVDDLDDGAVAQAPGFRAALQLVAVVGVKAMETRLEPIGIKAQACRDLLVPGIRLVCDPPESSVQLILVDATVYPLAHGAKSIALAKG